MRAVHGRFADRQEPIMHLDTPKAARRRANWLPLHDDET